MITLHHLNKSRSKRILWLLEELDVPYQVKAYQRDSKTNLAPAELKAIHPLGKSPVIELNGSVLAESGAITEYLTERFSDGTLAPDRDSDAYPLYLQWLHFAESSAAFPLLLKYFVAADGAKTNMLDGYANKEVGAILSYLDHHLSHHRWLVGEQFTAADIMISFVVEMSDRAGLLEHFPALKAYSVQLQDKPAAKRAASLEAQLDDSQK